MEREEKMLSAENSKRKLMGYTTSRNVSEGGECILEIHKFTSRYFSLKVHSILPLFEVGYEGSTF